MRRGARRSRRVSTGWRMAIPAMLRQSVGLSELRIDFGPGYRVYYGRTGKTIYLLLCGGDKGTQDVDIKNAHAMWKVLNPLAKKPGKEE